MTNISVNKKTLQTNTADLYAVNDPYDTKLR